MDGTLIDSEKFWRQAEVDIFTKYGVITTLDETVVNTGLSIPEIVNLKKHQFKFDDIIAANITNEIFSTVAERIGTLGVAKEGAYGALELLQQQGFTLALASTSPLFIIDVVLKRLQLSNVFSVISSAEQEVYGKPNPAVYLSCLKSLDKDPLQCVAIEDSFNGVIAAKAARIMTIAIPEMGEQYGRGFYAADYILPSLKNFDVEFLTKLNSTMGNN